MKTKFINQLKSGEELQNIILAVKSSQDKTTKNGNKFKDLILGDKTGEINAKIWADSFAQCQDFVDQDIVSVDAKVTEFNGSQQLIVKSLVVLEQNQIDQADFINSSAKDQDELLLIIKNSIKKIKNKFLKKLVNVFFEDQEFLAKFKIAPGAQNIHHAYLGGLMEHTAEMLNFAEPIFKDYPDLNQDLLIAGILLHDLGKMQELAVGSTIIRTVEGNLLGHLILSANQVDLAISKIKYFPSKLRWQILHLILSHHGKLEFGSPVQPMTTEAFALHFLDQMSAKLNASYYLTKYHQKTGEEFSARNYALETKLYIPPKDDDCEQKNKSENTTLF